MKMEDYKDNRNEDYKPKPNRYNISGGLSQDYLRELRNLEKSSELNFRYAEPRNTAGYGNLKPRNY